MRETAACVLVATPVHLKRLADSQALHDARGVCRAVFSSGGPLEADTAQAIGTALGATPFEILGSTETGGVAVRQRGTATGERWQPLPRVRVTTEPDEGRLRVTSPFVSCGEPGDADLQSFTMGDRATLGADGCFELLGRADRTVKVGEKRLSLPDMERALQEQPGVAEAALFVAPRAGEPRVHAVVVPTPAGRAILATTGRRAFGAQLVDELARAWDRVLLPRAWRFVDALPRNSQGKLPSAALRALFEKRAANPRIASEERDGNRLVRLLHVPVDLAGIEGHFEGYPVGPGVMQLGWALDAAAVLLGETARVRRLDAVKFPTLLRPGASVRLEVELLDDGARLRFTLRVADEISATGRCLLAGRKST
jgi:acyl-coenzyme A synthetase/AMP-(fatty) acid ligase